MSAYLPLAEELEAAEADASAALDALRGELYLTSPSETQCAHLLAAASRAVRLFELELDDAALPPEAAEATRRELERQQLSLRQLQAAAEVAARQRLLGGGGAASSAGDADGGGGGDDLERMTAQQIIARGSAVQDESLASLQRAQAQIDDARRLGVDTLANMAHQRERLAATRRQAIEWEAVVREGHREVNKIAHGFLTDAALQYMLLAIVLGILFIAVYRLSHAGAADAGGGARDRGGARLRWPTKLHTALSLYDA